MKGFRFRLEKLRDLRRMEEEGRARAVAQASDSVATAQKLIDGIIESEAEVLDRIRTIVTSGPRVGLVQNMQVVLGQLRRQRAVAQAQRVKAEEELKTARLAFQEAYREREILDRLRERQMDSWNREEGRREQAVLDEASRRGASGLEKGASS